MIYSKYRIGNRIGQIVHYDYQEKYIMMKSDTNRIIDEIISCISGIKVELFHERIRKNRTILVKKELAILGHNIGYKCYGNGLNSVIDEIGNNFKNVEFLYDFQWYTEKENTDYITKELIMALECEWDYFRKEDRATPYSSVKYDYQKLIVSKARVKIMISKIKSVSDLSLLRDYYINSIKSFEYNSIEADKYLCFALNCRNKKMYLFENSTMNNEWKEI